MRMCATEVASPDPRVTRCDPGCARSHASVEVEVSVCRTVDQQGGSESWEIQRARIRRLAQRQVDWEHITVGGAWRRSAADRGAERGDVVTGNNTNQQWRTT